MRLKRQGALVIVLLVVVVFTATPPPGSAAGRCWAGTNFFHENAGGTGHWYVFVPKNVSAPLTAWYAVGPWGAMLWPNSVTTYYVKVYFSWPDSVNPWYFLRPSQFQACLH
jgi:hypothetical protein